MRFESCKSTEWGNRRHSRTESSLPQQRSLGIARNASKVRTVSSWCLVVQEWVRQQSDSPDSRLSQQHSRAINVVACSCSVTHQKGNANIVVPFERDQGHEDSVSELAVIISKPCSAVWHVSLLGSGSLLSAAADCANPRWR